MNNETYIKALEGRIAQLNLELDKVRNREMENLLSTEIVLDEVVRGPITDDEVTPLHEHIGRIMLGQSIKGDARSLLEDFAKKRGVL